MRRKLSEIYYSQALQLERRLETDPVLREKPYRRASVLSLRQTLLRNAAEYEARGN